MDDMKPRLFETAMAMRAMLNLGYKDTDYALAEIIDNSIEANAKNIDVIIVQALGGNTRSVWQVKTIAVLDDGYGIEPSLLTRVLSFGYGTHRDASFEPGDKSFGKLGKFGVGLPNASISQAKDISVYSWQGGTDKTYVSELFVEKILSGQEESQRPARKASLPNTIRQVFQTLGITLGNSGTLVIWDRVTDRCSWSKGSTLMDKVEETAGRIFRKFIYDKGVKIRVTVFNENKLDKPVFDPRFVRVNDPMFLMSGSIADSYRKSDNIQIPLSESLFNRYPPQSYDSFDFRVPFKNNKNEDDEAIVRIRFSKCNPELRRRINRQWAGSTRVGQLAGRNQGVSVLRAGRELELTQSWLPGPDTRNRWIGAEVDFPPALDDYFGVGSTKQSASKLQALATNYSSDTILADFNEQWNLTHPQAAQKILWEQMIEILKKEGDKRWVLYTVAKTLDDNIRRIFNELKKDNVETKRPEDKDQDGNEPEGQGSDGALGGKKSGKEVIPFINATEGKEKPTALTLDQLDALGKQAAGDPNAPNASEDEKMEFERVLKFLKDNPDAHAVFSNCRIAANAFFDCDKEYDRVLIRFNKDHPAYIELFQQFGKVLDEAGDPDEQPEQRFENVDTLKVSFLLMIYAWASTEINLTDDDKLVARSVREQWGARLRKLYKELVKQRDG